MVEIKKQHDMSVSDAIHWAVGQLESSPVYFGHGTDNAVDESVWLVLFVLGESFDVAAEFYLTSISEEAWVRVQELVQQRIESRKPIAYLIQQAWFCHLSFYVDERVLVPRSPIAELIQAQFAPWVRPDQVHSVLDLCCGGGCIGIASAMAFADAKVVLSDISADALAVAKMNVDRHQLQDRVSIVAADLFAEMPDQVFDIIVSNPPYVDAEDMASVPDEYKHEPELGLTAGHDGLDVALLILQQAPRYMSESGLLFVEVGNSQEALMALLPTLSLTWLDFQQGGHGVFCIRRQELLDGQEAIAMVLAARG